MIVNVNIHVGGKERVVVSASDVIPSVSPMRTERKIQGLENWQVDVWWRKYMFVHFMQGLQIHQNLMGAKAAELAGQSVELSSIEMAARESEKPRVRAYRSAHGTHLHAEKLVRKELTEGLKVALSKSIPADIIRSFIEGEIDLMGERESYGLSPSTKAELKALVYQSELQDLV